MKAESVIAVFQALNDHHVRYVVCGGLAVIAHGHLRTTQDIDLAFAFEADNFANGLRALGGLGYRPVQPVSLESLGDPAQRQRLVQEKKMIVLNLFSDRFPDAEVDVFTDFPYDFEAIGEMSRQIPLFDGLSFPCLRLDSLIEMKRKAGRLKDLADIETLEHIRKYGRRA